MLHISDVENRLKNCPEPPEVTEMRERIAEAFSNLEFFEVPHKYTLHKANGEDVELPSVSSIVERFVPKVDWDTVRKNKAKRLGITDDELRRQWRENNLKSTSNGSKTHLFGESCMYMFQGKPELIDDEISHYQLEDGFLIPYGPKEIAASKLYEDILNNYNVFPVMAESKIYTGYNDTLKLKGDYCGTFDMLWAYKNSDKNPKYVPMVLDFKGLPLDTPILTTKGFKNMGDLTKEDQVFDKNGEVCNILNISSVHHNPCYKIVFDDGYEITSDYEHRWEVSFLNTWSKKYIPKVMTTQELKIYLDGFNNQKNRYGYKIPKIMINKPLNLPNADLPIDPYILGVWLGDGSKACGVVTNMYSGIFEEIKRRGFQIGEDVSNGSSGQASSRTIYGLRTLLRVNDLLNNKHIPENYFLASYEQRMDLLRGIMDTDGYYNKVRKRFVIGQTDDTLTKDIATLLATLGIKTKIFKVKKGYKTHEGKKKYFMSHEICFWCDDYPYKIRKIDIKKPLIDKHSFRNILRVEAVEEVPTRCIEVDSESHTYLASRELIVTHNTNKSLTNDYNRMKGNMMLPPFDDMVDEPLSHYTIQLSAYQMGLEQLGIYPQNRVLIWLKEDGTYEKIPVKDVRDRLKAIL